jgi:hypothetical protein
MNAEDTSAQPAVRLAEPYALRSVRCLELLTFDGWRLKLYGIAYRGERPVQALVDAAVAAAQGRLPCPAVTDDRYGMGFVGVHDGRGANFVFVDWWANEDELHQHAWLPSREPARLRATGPDDFIAYVGPRGNRARARRRDPPCAGPGRRARTSTPTWATGSTATSDPSQFGCCATRV